MKTFPAAYATEKDRKTGLHPVWILQATIGGTVYYLSSIAVTVTPWSVTTKAWVKAWGSVQEGITGALEEFHISNLDIDIVINPADSPNMETLTLENELEENPVSLYCWFNGCADPPQEYFRGYVRECSIVDNCVKLSLQDETIRLERNFIGTKIDRTTYPSADPDDVGKIIPIIFGTVTKLPALAVDAGIMTALPAAITSTATSFAVSDATGLTAGMTLQVDDEKMYINSVSGDTLGVTRGYSSTTAVAHQKGATAWQVKSAFAYLIADHAVDSISKVFVVAGEDHIDITSACTLYPAGNHASYPGKAAITIPDYAKVQQAMDIALTGDVTLQSSSHSHVTGNTSQTTNQNANSYPNSSGLSVTIPSSGMRYYFNGYLAHTYFTNLGTVTACTLAVNVTVTISGMVDNPLWCLTLGGIAVTGWYSTGVSNQSFNITVTDATAMQQTALTVYVQGDDLPAGYTNTYTAFSATINSASRNITYVVGGVATTAASANVTRTNTLALSGNSVANTLVGSQLLVNVSRSFSSPVAAMQSLISYSGSAISLSQSGSMPGSYTLNGAITEYKTCLEWLNIMAFQLRSWFRVERGFGKLIVRPDSLTSSRTIAACKVGADGIKSYSRRKMETADIINKINLLFDRDWMKSGDTAYRQCSKETDSTSISTYGEKERPELFRCDFIADATHAASVRSFYLGYYKTRHWLHEFELFLDNAGISFSDVLTLGFSNNAVGQVLEVGYNPGDANTIDTIRITAIV